MNKLWVLSVRIKNIYKFLSFMVVILAVSVLIVSKSTYAENGGEKLSWTNASPEIFDSSPTNTVPSSTCPHAFNLEDIAGETNKKELCISEGAAISFGYTDGSYKAFVGFVNDKKMHRVYGTCIQYDSCLYLPATDTMVTKQNLINGVVRSLVIYKNYSKRLSSFINPANLTKEYIFDQSNPDYVFKDSSGYAWPIGGFGASDNGKWLAIEIRQRGIGLLNLETLDIKRISTMSFGYGYGYDPTSELAVTNNGEVVAIVGMNAGMTIFENNVNCGDIITDEKLWNMLPIFKPCKSSPIQYGNFIDRFFFATHPRLTDDGYGLDFFAVSYDGKQNEISLRAAGYGGIKLEYLALGDSYTSGEGEYSDQYYLEGTNEDFEKCHVSSRSYPFLLADFSNLDLNLVKSVACSGAKTEDIVGNDDDYWGQNSRLGEQGMVLTKSEKLSLQIESKRLFIQGRIRQETFVKEYIPRIITVGIGGNDIGIVDKLKTCVGPGTCNWASDPKMREQFAVEIKNLFNTLANMYQEIHDSSPNSKIYAVGYPLPADGKGICDPLTGLLLNSEERTFMAEAVIYLNQVIKAAADKVGIGFLDIQDSYGSHVMCGDENPSGINSLVLGDDIGISENSSWLKFIGNESFHPNPNGHLLAARYIFNSTGNITSYDYCMDKVTLCPKNIAVPEPSEYWIGEKYDNYPALISSNFVFDGPDVTNLLKKQAILPNFSLLPNSKVEIEINSVPITLGIFNVNNEGALSVELDLPIDLEEGFHAIHIYGASYSGEQVDLYQVIKYQTLPLTSPGEDNQKVLNDIVDFNNEKKENLETVLINGNEKENVEQIKYKSQDVKENIELSRQIETSSSPKNDVITRPEVLGLFSDKADENNYNSSNYGKGGTDNAALIIFMAALIAIIFVASVVIKRSL